MSVSLSLSQVLSLVGRLDDTSGQDTPRERFRHFLEVNVGQVGQVRDYVEECLRTPGDQYNRALQDLVNHIGCFLGFNVTFGRYQGVVGQIGFDGLWGSPSGLHVVVEVKTSDVYSIKTSALVGYIDKLISDEKRISDWDHALGLYVIGRLDPEVHQLQNAIVAEKRTHQLRIISINSLLSLAALASVYDVKHQDILSVLRPSGPTIDPLVDLMTRLAAERQVTNGEEGVIPPEPEEEATKPSLNGNDHPVTPSQQNNFWLTPVRTDEEEAAEDLVQRLVGENRVYAFGDNTPGRKRIRAGDLIAFYASGKGVVAHATIASEPERKPHKAVRHSDTYPWVFTLREVHLYTDNPVVIDATLRAQLEAFKGKDPNAAYWGILVQANRKLTEHDYRLLTRS